MQYGVTWDWGDGESYWIQCGDKKITEVLASILQLALDSTNLRLLSRVMRILQSTGGIFCDRRRVGGVNSEMRQEIVAKALKNLSRSCRTEQKLTSAVRSCLAQSSEALPLVPKKYREEMTKCAVDDLLWLIKEQRFDDAAHYYDGVRHEEWAMLPAHQRLALTFALRPRATTFRHDRQEAIKDGWEGCDDAVLESYLRPRVRASLQLAVQVASKFRSSSYGSYTMHTCGPLSLAIFLAIEAVSDKDKPSPKHNHWFDGSRSYADASTLALATNLAFSCLNEAMPGSKFRTDEVANKVRQHLFLYASPAILLLGAGAGTHFGLLQEREHLVAEHMIACEQQSCRPSPSLVRLCGVASKFTLGVERPLLAALVLKTRYDITFEDSRRLVKILCDTNASAEAADQADRSLTTGQITSIRLLLHVQDQELAIGLVQKICMHAIAKKGTRSAGREDGGRLVKAIRWKFAEGRSELAFLPALIAIRLGGIWLDSTVAHVEKLSGLSHLSHDDDDYRIAVAESQMPAADLDLLRDILDFASQIIREEKPIALNCVEPKSKVLLSFQEHLSWADKMCKAVNTDAFNAEGKLAQELIGHGQSIPLAFISFLVSKASLDPAAEAYRSRLLGSTPADKLERFLPAADEAKKKSVAAGRLDQWLERTIRNNSSETLKHKMQALKDNIMATQLSTFPECLGTQDMHKDTALREALSVFMDSAHPTVGTVGSDLIDQEARNILETYADTEDPLRVPGEARKRVKRLLERIFRGEVVTHDKVKLDRERFARSAPDLKREQRALVALLQVDEPDDVERFLKLVLVDAQRLLRWSQLLADFLTDTLKVRDMPPALQVFLEVYSDRDRLASLRFFCRDCGQSGTQDDGPSMQHMLCTFERIFFGVPQEHWAQIDHLPDLLPLVHLFRDKFKDAKTLQRKMDALRWVFMFVFGLAARHLVTCSSSFASRDRSHVCSYRCASTIGQTSSWLTSSMKSKDRSSKSPAASGTK